MIGALTNHVWQSTLLAAAAGLLTLAAPALAQEPQTGGRAASSPAPAPVPKFEVVSVKPGVGCEDRPGRGGGRSSASPGRLSAECVTVETLIRWAYAMYGNGKEFPMVSRWQMQEPIQGGPGWVRSDRYTIDAKAEGPATVPTMRGPMVQALLADKFQLEIHRESKEVPVYALTVAKGGPKLKPTQEGSCIPPEVGLRNDPLAPPGKSRVLCGMFFMFAGVPESPGVLGTTLPNLASQMASRLDRDVVDKTGIAGKFDVHFEFSADDLAAIRPRPVAPDDPSSGTYIPEGDDATFAAFQSAVGRLGLKLEPAKGSRQFLAIDRIERPPGN